MAMLVLVGCSMCFLAPACPPACLTACLPACLTVCAGAVAAATSRLAAGLQQPCRDVSAELAAAGKVTDKRRLDISAPKFSPLLLLATS
eukprot:180987-Chlamydomonas_euryale.AAC.1